MPRSVAFARRYDIIICHDNPYSDIAYDGYRAPSILQVPGARDVAVEFNSLSKTYNMAGARVGMVVGNAAGDRGAVADQEQHRLRAADHVATDGHHRADRRPELDRRAQRVYQRRRDLLCAALARGGHQAPPPRASLYIWGAVPAGMTSAAFADQLFDQQAMVVTPGTSFGASGEGYFRMSLTVPDKEVALAAERLATLRF